MRPNKIYGYNIYSKQYEPLRDKLLEVFSYVEDKYGEILNAYNGLALGFDTIAFEELYFSKRDTNIIGCIPFEKQASKWNKESIEVYNIMKSKCDEIVYVDTVDQYKVKNTIEGEYNVVKMMKRNELMIDNSNVLISCWNHGKNGGSGRHRGHRRLQNGQCGQRPEKSRGQCACHHDKKRHGVHYPFDL